MTAFSSLDPLFDDFPPTSTEAWEAKIREDLGGTDYESALVWHSIEGVTLQPYYRRIDLDNVAHVDASVETPPLAGRPRGDGSAPTGWRVRQDLAGPDLEAARRQAGDAVERGATDLGLLAAPALGRRSGGAVPDNRALPFSGRGGLPIDGPDALRQVLADVDLDAAGLHLVGGPASAALLAALEAVADERGVAPSALRGSVDFDPTAALATGAWANPDAAYRLAADLVDHHPEAAAFRTATVRLTPYHDAGASIVQELAAAMGAACELVDRCTERGVGVDRILDRLQWVVPVSTTYFLEIAKLRALRLLVPQVLQPFADAAGLDREVTEADVHIQAVPSVRPQTVYDPYVNMLRGTTEAMAAAVGGADVLSVAPYDAAFQAPSDFSSRIARNTQLILSHEAHVDRVRDPAAGSYYIEAATDRVARKAWSAFQELEADGGLLPALRAGRLQEAIADVRDERTEAVEVRKRVLVGTNHYPDLGESRQDDLPDGGPPDTPSPAGGGASEKPTRAPLRKAWGSVAGLRDAMAGGASLPALVRAVAPQRADAPPVAPLPAVRLGEAFEALRRRTERYAGEHDGPPTVFLLPIGPPAWRGARATFARNFFGVAGFDVAENLRFETVEAGVDAALEAGADVVVLCSADDEYADLVAGARSRLDAAPEGGFEGLLVVAGNPSRIGGLEAGGRADLFVHRGSRLRDVLTDVQDRLGL
jgi:methylmalonyl-CoA mutase